MAINKLNNVPYNDFRLNEVINPEYFDANFATLVEKLDSAIDVINALEATTDGKSGANKIGMTPIQETGALNTIQEVIEALVTLLKKTDGTGGGTFIGAKAIPGLDGANIQAVIESLKSLIDTHKISSDHDTRYDARYTNAVHKMSGDHDNRYFTQAELQAVDGINGAALIGTPPLSGITSTNVAGQLSKLRDLITQMTLGQIPDGTIGRVKLDADAKGLLDSLDNGYINTPTISLGANIVKHTGKVAVLPEIKFKGIDYVNLISPYGSLDKDSNLDGIADGWEAILMGATPTVVNGRQKITTTESDTGYDRYMQIWNKMVAGKYYFIACDVEADSVAQAGISVHSTDGNALSQIVTNEKKRIGIKYYPQDISTVNIVRFGLSNPVGTIGTAYYDNYLLKEISADEYSNLTIDQLLTKYPYVESYGCLTNPYFENRRYNLVRNGNCEEGVARWIPKSPTSLSELTITNGKFSLVTTGDNHSFIQSISVKDNTNYTIKAKITGNGFLQVYDGSTTQYAVLSAFTASATFNTGNETCLRVFMINGPADTTYFDSIMLIEGTVAPAEYLSSDPQEFVIEGQFAYGDEVEIKDGKPSGELWSKHKTLYGKDYDWILGQDKTGFKEIQLALFHDVIENRPHTTVKFDGKILGRIADLGGFDTSDESYCNWNKDLNFYASVSDLDSGWAESINPNNDEVKAFTNGWKATANDGTRYTAWVSVVDGVTTPTEQNIVYVAKNIASNYEGYRLHYKLANPEPVTDANIHIHGDIWSIVPGDNYINVGSGIVLKEVANPWYYSGASQWLFNNTYASSSNYSRFQNKAEDILTVYKNDNIESAFVEAVNETNAYGRNDGYILNTNFDPNATYTVDYQILKTLHAQSFGSLTMSYAQDVFTAVTGMGKALEEKQQQDSTLDTLVGLSVYEVVNPTSLIQCLAWYYSYLRLQVEMVIPFKVVKRVVPVIVLNKFKVTKCISSSEVDVTDKFIIAGLNVTKELVKLIVSTDDATTISDIKANGVRGYFTATADCRRRI